MPKLNPKLKLGLLIALPVLLVLVLGLGVAVAFNQEDESYTGITKASPSIQVVEDVTQLPQDLEATPIDEGASVLMDILPYVFVALILLGLTSWVAGRG